MGLYFRMAEQTSCAVVVTDGWYIVVMVVVVAVWRLFLVGWYDYSI